ncbi:metallophosphoesterase [Ensifer sp. ENS12]|uniref:metallophosphoesterase n=1 Tax=Ensifer sp. ENS12 TaxID=2854774 RepID=UPI001C43B375|nr:metallophosphoesterase [Ensifer sp. ENS12]MBV7518966.1 metallophosphoesterase [Ensifer sp. ENS12]
MRERHIFAIGDIHGCADLLETLLVAIGKRADDMLIDYSVVFLGDVIDRGQNSNRALDMVEEAIASIPGSSLILGNHDWFPIRILDELSGDERDMALHHWIYRLGGSLTLLSYGFDPDAFSVSDLEKHFPTRHLSLLRSAVSHVELPRHILVHAGLAPNIPLAQQSRRDLMWIGEPFLSSTDTFEKTVIHGHTVTPSRQCEKARHRIGIDTGAYATGRLSAAHIHPDGAVDFLETSTAQPGSVQVVAPHYVS